MPDRGIRRLMALALAAASGAVDGFNAVVLEGKLSARGMASFADALKPEDTFRIRNFLIDAANKLKAGLPPAAPAQADTHGQQ